MGRGDLGGKIQLGLELFSSVKVVMVWEYGWSWLVRVWMARGEGVNEIWVGGVDG